MKRSDDVELRELENNVILMLEAARTGNTRDIRKLVSKGFSPPMVNADGRSALNEAIGSFQIDAVDCLLDSKAKEQLMLWHETKSGPELPLHTAASIGFVEALKRVLKDYPEVNVSKDGWPTALCLAAKGCHLDVVRLLLRGKAQVLSTRRRDFKLVETPFHAVLTVTHTGQAEVFDIVKLLLEADDGHECMNYKDLWGMTTLFHAARIGYA